MTFDTQLVEKKTSPAEQAELTEARRIVSSVIIPPAEPNYQASALPWVRPELKNWDIIGMNHYHFGEARFLFVSMGRKGRYIKAEGADNQALWDDLAHQAQRSDEAAH